MVGTETGTVSQRFAEAKLSDSESLVIGKLTTYGLRCKRFTKEERRRQKTPDFRVYLNEDFAFYCEVKEVAEDPWLLGERPDPIFNRLSDDIHEGVKQFDGVNCDLKHPNVLALVNNDRMCGSLDLLCVLTGHLLTKKGWEPVYIKYSQGRIRDEKYRIDLYLWFDSFKADKVIFTRRNQAHFKRLCSFLGIDPKNVRAIGNTRKTE